jgi:hypothetical protein
LCLVIAGSVNVIRGNGRRTETDHQLVHTSEITVHE